MDEFQPRYADQAFTEPVTFQGVRRKAELRSMGRGHSEDDAVLLLSGEKIAFIGDIGFFDCQPFLGFCDLDLHRRQLQFFLDADYQVLVPGHGPVGDKRDLRLQLDYLAVMENLVSEVIQHGGSLKDAQKISLPEPFDRWLMGGMSRFEINVSYFYKYLGGI
jgi:glyoxylase-like metal-dependent hydrolase (beta-lactamase superfamily II)